MTGEQKPVRFEDCPEYQQTTFTGRRVRCKCGLCSLCGNPKHSSIHGGTLGEPDKLWGGGHYFEPIRRKHQ